MFTTRYKCVYYIFFCRFSLFWLVLLPLVFCTVDWATQHLVVLAMVHRFTVWLTLRDSMAPTGQDLGQAVLVQDMVLLDWVGQGTPPGYQLENKITATRLLCFSTGFSFKLFHSSSHIVKIILIFHNDEFHFIDVAPIQDSI